MNVYYLLLGSNTGNRLCYLRDACRDLCETGEIPAVSAVYETSPWGYELQAPFLNCAVKLQTQRPPLDLLNILKNIEKNIGRTTNFRWGPRVIDIDILLFNDSIHHTPTLQIPHPRLAERRFALVPLAEIAAGAQHPLLKKTIAQLLVECSDTGSVKLLITGAEFYAKVFVSESIPTNGET
ncbi:MAG: 2-amino-4-hydroxy-6-hydroxymethyldihydropteridine diphosphokinase [Chitinophagales bacterium]|nr:2-amino-4-hydroxy-6-hydroxymethyldihydropteridine diphosphokinase [Chitinophagales bacterium]MDW8418776.1 2-amino-4-hydroxy-6-hydroxymethyldihydropteridine diphosphokinase [Chitinophagales bacterium]